MFLNLNSLFKVSHLKQFIGEELSILITNILKTNKYSTITNYLKWLYIYIEIENKN